MESHPTTVSTTEADFWPAVHRMITGRFPDWDTLAVGGRQGAAGQVSGAEGGGRRYREWAQTAMTQRRHRRRAQPPPDTDVGGGWEG